MFSVCFWKSCVTFLMINNLADGIFIIRYSTEQLFNVAAAVDMYQEFLPWCQRSDITRRNPDGTLDAELEIGFNFFVESYVSQWSWTGRNLLRWWFNASWSCPVFWASHLWGCTFEISTDLYSEWWFFFLSIYRQLHPRVPYLIIWSMYGNLILALFQGHAISIFWLTSSFNHQFITG